MKEMNALKIKNPIGFSIDNLARSVYVTLRNSKVKRTIRKSNHMLIDYDEHDKIVGVELICLSEAKIHLATKRSFSDIKSIIPELSAA